MTLKCKRQVNVIYDGSCEFFRIHNSLTYQNKKLFLTKDVKRKNKLLLATTIEKKFLRKWGLIKRRILNVENIAAKKTIASIPDGALPSGTDWSLFVKRLIYNLCVNWSSKESTDAMLDEGLSVIRGSVAKAAG